MSAKKNEKSPKRNGTGGADLRIGGVVEAGVGKGDENGRNGMTAGVVSAADTLTENVTQIADIRAGLTVLVAEVADKL